VYKNIPDSFKVVQRDVIANVFIGSEQNGATLIRLELKGSNPGVEVFGRKLTLQVLQTGLPGVLGHSR
jgi:hypothetical protein